jgi:CO/xanthine dehydrogenase FAD-binding subunit
MKPPPFSYERASDLEEVLGFLVRHGGDGKILAGGQSLVPLLNLRLARPSALIDLNGVRGLDYIRVKDRTLRLGALVRQASLETSPLLSDHVPLLVEAIRHVGHAQIRNRGTVGGSVAHADPAAELPACLVALGATFHVRSPRGGRAVAWADFFRGRLTTALAEDEILIEVEVPLPPRESGHAFLEFARRRGDFALGGASAVVCLDGDGLCTSAAIGMLAAGDIPVRAHSAEAMLLGGSVDEARVGDVADEAVRDISPAPDVHGSTEFRRRVSRELVRRALLLASVRASARMGC